MSKSSLHTNQHSSLAQFEIRQRSGERCDCAHTGCKSTGSQPAILAQSSQEGVRKSPFLACPYPVWGFHSVGRALLDLGTLHGGNSPLLRYLPSVEVSALHSRRVCNETVLVRLVNSKETNILTTLPQSPCLSSQGRPPEQDGVVICIRLCPEVAIKFILLKLRSMSLIRLQWATV